MVKDNILWIVIDNALKSLPSMIYSVEIIILLYSGVLLSLSSSNVVPDSSVLN